MRTTLSKPNFTARIAEDRLRLSRVFDLPATERPREGFAASPAFNDGHGSTAVFEQAYSSAMSLVWGDRPSLADVRRRVAEYADLM